MTWQEGYPLARIVEFLDRRNDWDLNAPMALQMDQVSIPWREMRDVVLEVAPNCEEGRRAIELLTPWKGVMESDSVGATGYTFFLSALVKRMARV